MSTILRVILECLMEYLEHYAGVFPDQSTSDANPNLLIPQNTDDTFVLLERCNVKVTIQNIITDLAYCVELCRAGVL